MEKLLFDLYFSTWFHNQLSADQRWILEADEDFSHAKSICEKETDKQEFFWWHDRAKAFAELKFNIEL